MRSSLGHEIVNLNGISTRQAFEFLLGLARPGRVLVCFGLNYDANQWVRDLTPTELAEVWETTATASLSLPYRVTWWPRKLFTIRNVQTREYCAIADVFGYFQSSFIAALQRWGVGSETEIARMKDQRATFTLKDLDNMRSYCLRECELLVTLMDRLADSIYDAGLAPSRPGSARSWIGAGTLASTLLANNGVADHHAHDIDIADRGTVETAILGAMFGGRIEILAAGVTPRALSRDIRSAYPAATSGLPSLAGATIRHRKRYRPGLQAIWRVRWDAADSRIVPFPARRPDGTVWYVTQGSGCYHAAEVDAAVALGYDVRVLEGWELKPPARAGSPFGWVDGVYQERARLKRRGHPAEKALKLALNSCYGKLAQGYSASVNNSLPRWQSYWWAGAITAATRARMVTAAHSARGPVMIATDGIYAGRVPAARPRDRGGLGTWEGSLVTQLFSAQPGVYHADGGIVRSRGFRASEMDWDELRDGYERHGLDHVQSFQSRRFIGLGVALQRGLGVWRTWTEETRSLCLYPDRKVVMASDQRGYHLLAPYPGPIDSEPYAPKSSLYDDPTPAQIENMIADDQPDPVEGSDQTGDFL
jgi:hypothetical protein